MAVFYKFKSAKHYDSIPTDGPSISVATLKQNILQSMHSNGGTDFNLVVTNAQTNAGWLMFNLKFKESQVDSLNSKFHLLVLLLYSLHCNIVKGFV